MVDKDFPRLNQRPTSRGVPTSLPELDVSSDAPTLSLVRPRVEPEPELEPELRATDRETSVVLPHEGAVAIACGSGVLMVQCNGTGRAKLEFDAGKLDVFLQVDDMVELYDGALIGAGKRWFRFERSSELSRASLKMLGADGAPMIVMALSEGVFTVGRQIGDFTLPAEREFAVLHFQIVLRGPFVFLRNLAQPGCTWLILSPGEMVPTNGTLVAEHRLVQLRSPSRRPANSLEADVPQSASGQRTGPLLPADEPDERPAPAVTSPQRRAAQSG